MNWNVATKALIVKDEKVLILTKTKSILPHLKGLDFPGGRLNLDESPKSGLKREIKEETGLDVDIIRLVHATDIFKNEQMRLIGLCYLCRPKSTKIKLSEEHSTFEWIDIKTAKAELPGWLGEMVNQL